jgi:hypothetical protein
MRNRRLWSSSGIAVVALAGAGLAGAAPPEVLTGVVSRPQIEAAAPSWTAVAAASEVDADAARALAEVAPGAAVTVYFGTWCSDSRREVSRFWHALDAAGAEMPFTVRYVAVDRSKEVPAELAAKADLQYVPTFVVERGGQEVGRVVETAVSGIEGDLLALLTGGATGVLSASEPQLAAGGGESGPHR